MILYFSGTGNTKFVAECLAEELEDSIISMGALLKAEQPLNAVSEKPFVFLAPIYAWRWPRAVEKLIEGAGLQGTRRVYCIATRESQSARAGKFLERIFRKMGMEYMGFTSVDMPNQYVLADPVSAPEDTVKDLRGALPLIRQIAEEIRRGRPLRDDGNTLFPELMSGLVNAACVRFLMSSRNFAVSDACIGCGNCAARCPMNNIVMENQHPVFQKRCMWCFSCVQFCPKSAIDVKGRTEGKARYTCPEYRTFQNIEVE